MSPRTSVWHSGRTGAYVRLKIVALLGTDRLHRPNKSEVNRSSRFNWASKNRQTELVASRIDRFKLHIFVVYRTPFTNCTLDFHEIWHACRRRYATHSHQISSRSNMPFVREREKKLAVNRRSPRVQRN